MTAGFGGVRQYVELLIFMYKVTSIIRFDLLFGVGGVGGGGYEKRCTVVFRSKINLRVAPYSYLIIILFRTDLCKSLCSNFSFKKLVFCLSVLCILSVLL